MSRVADLLLAYGKTQGDLARQRGLIWGNAVQNIAEIPLQVQQQQLQQKRIDALTLLEQAKAAREAGDYQMAQEKFHQSQALAAGQQQVDAAALAADPNNYDADAGMRKAVELGLPGLPDYALSQRLKFHPPPKWETVAPGATGGTFSQEGVFTPGYTAPPKVEPGSLGEYVTKKREALKAAGQSEGPDDLLKWDTEYKAANRARTNEEAALDAFAKSLGKTSADDLTDADRQTYAKRQATIASNQSFFQHTRERQYDIANPIPEKTPDQAKLEQQYRTVLVRAMSNRSGGIGSEDAKVQQANHLLGMLDQFYDPKTGDYNIPRVQQNELALGLAKLTAGTGPAGEGMMREFQQRTAKGDLAGALTYVTGQPVAANTQAITKMLRESIERQGGIAEQNREGEMGYLRGLAPTDLEESRRQALERTTLNPLRRSRVAIDAKGNRRLFVSTDGGQTWK